MPADPTPADARKIATEGRNVAEFLIEKCEPGSLVAGELAARVARALLAALDEREALLADLRVLLAAAVAALDDNGWEHCVDRGHGGEILAAIARLEARIK